MLVRMIRSSCPARQPVRGGAVEEVMLARPLPDEVPGMFRVDANGTFAMIISRVKDARGLFLKWPLAISDFVLVLTGRGRREADPVNRSVRRITESFRLQLLATVYRRENSGHRHIRERIVRIRVCDCDGHFDEIVGVD